MIFELFVLGGFWFWALSIVLSAVFFGLFANDKVIGATISVIIYALAVSLFGNINILEWLWYNPWIFWKYCGIYIGCGAAWSIGKWYLLNAKILRILKEIESEYKIDNERLKVKPSYESWIRYLNDSRKMTKYTGFHQINKTEDVIPSSWEYKSAIVCWAMFWPLSILWYILKDAIIEIFERLYRFLSGFYQSITNWVFKGIGEIGH